MIDTHRAASPLRMAEDAVEVDCSRMTLEEVVQKRSPPSRGRLWRRKREDLAL